MTNFAQEHGLPGQILDASLADEREPFLFVSPPGVDNGRWETLIFNSREECNSGDDGHVSTIDLGSEEDLEYLQAAYRTAMLCSALHSILEGFYGGSKGEKWDVQAFGSQVDFVEGVYARYPTDFVGSMRDEVYEIVAQEHLEDLGLTE